MVMNRQIKTIDLFCTIIDNFGDIGVCWRLAQQLRQEHQLTVRLWVDDLTSFARLLPALNVQLAEQTIYGIEVRHWIDHATNNISPYDVVIEGFGCRLPESYLQKMATRTPASQWLNLEYLSAESWTLSCHSLPSAHPTLPLQQYFFFPSFSAQGGGLLREHDLLQRRDAFQADVSLQQQFWQQLGYPHALQADYRLSLFAYENAAVPALLAALSQQQQNCFLAIPEGRVLANVYHWLGKTLAVGDCVTIGTLTIAVIPFLLPDDYDRLLWACDLNIVRGEDSFIRAHWANRPLLWHIYPQQENAHLVKLEAWLETMQVAVPELPEAYLDAQRAWNREETSIAYWRQLLQICADARIHHQRFIDSLSRQTDLATRLIDFCTK